MNLRRVREIESERETSRLQQQVHKDCAKVHKTIFHSAESGREERKKFVVAVLRAIFIRWMYPSIHFLCFHVYRIRDEIFAAFL